MISLTDVMVSIEWPESAADCAVCYEGQRVTPCQMTLHEISWFINTLRPRQNGRHFPDDIFKCIFLNKNVWIPIKISLQFVPKGPINNNPALVQIMAWRRPGGKPLSEPMTVSFLTHICVTRPQWVMEMFDCSIILSLHCIYGMRCLSYHITNFTPDNNGFCGTTTDIKWHHVRYDRFTMRIFHDFALDLSNWITF